MNGKSAIRTSIGITVPIAENRVLQDGISLRFAHIFSYYRILLRNMQ